MANGLGKRSRISGQWKLSQLIGGLSQLLPAARDLATCQSQLFFEGFFTIAQGLDLDLLAFGEP